MAEIIRPIGVLIVLSLAVGVPLGCGEEPRYQDRPLSEWMRQLDDNDYATRREALVAIKRMGPYASAAKGKLRGMAARGSPDALVVLDAVGGGIDARALLPQFIEVLEDPNGYSKTSVLGAIWEVHPDAITEEDLRRWRSAEADKPRFERRWDYIETIDIILKDRAQLQEFQEEQATEQGSWTTR